MRKNSLPFAGAINQALDSLLARYPEALIIGEDVADPFGGSFKVTQGLSTRYPGRVLNSPISEPLLAGMAAGLALAGQKPIVEVMFGDFLGLCADQIINHATKFPWMYGHDVPMPMMLRTASGSGKNYGPTHSQSLETLFLGVPNLTIWSPFPLHNLTALYEQALISPLPALMAESKALYPLRPTDSPYYLGRSNANGETLVFSNCGSETPDFVLMAYGRMAQLALDSLGVLFENEIFVHLFVPARIQPFDPAPLDKAIGQTGRVLILEEGWQAHGWGNFIAQQIYQRWFKALKSPVRILGARDLPIGTAPEIEAEALPGLDDLLTMARELIR